MAEKRFQGLCLVNDAGWKHMGVFDEFPPQIRQRLGNSPFNLCAACVYNDGLSDSEESLLRVIETMEATVRMLDAIQERRQQHGRE